MSVAADFTAGRRWPLVLLASLALVVCLTATLAAGSLPVTPQDPPSLVRVRTRIPEPVVYQQPERLKEKGALLEDCKTGCTQLELELSWSLDTTSVTFAEGDRLFWVSGIDVTLGYRSVDIFVSPRFQEGSCEYKAILEHERKHIRADRLLLEEYASRMQAALTADRWATYSEPQKAASAEEIREASKKRLSAVVQPLMDELKEKRQRAGEALDAAEGTLVFHRICGSTQQTGNGKRGR